MPVVSFLEGSVGIPGPSARLLLGLLSGKSSYTIRSMMLLGLAFLFFLIHLSLFFLIHLSISTSNGLQNVLGQSNLKY